MLMIDYFNTITHDGGKLNTANSATVHYMPMRCASLCCCSQHRENQGFFANTYCLA